MRNKKGQIAIIDFFVALGLFLIMLLILIVDWNIYSKNFNDNIDYNTLMTKAGHISDVLVTSEGLPPDWNSTDFTLPGLAVSDRNLSSGKVTSFKNISNSEIKDVFDMNIYEFNFTMVYTNGSKVFSLGSDLSGKKTAVNVRRYAKLGNDTVYLDVQIGQ